MRKLSAHLKNRGFKPRTSKYRAIRASYLRKGGKRS